MKITCVHVLIVQYNSRLMFVYHTLVSSISILVIQLTYYFVFQLGKKMSPPSTNTVPTANSI